MNPSMLRCGMVLVLGTLAVSCAGLRERGTAPVAYTAQFDLKYLTGKELYEPGIVPGYVYIKKFADVSQEKLTKEPRYVSSKPQYAALSMGDAGDRLYTIILDKSNSSGSYYTVYFDVNNNEDLTDDPPLGPFKAGVSESDLPPVEIPVSVGGTVHSYRLLVAPDQDSAKTALDVLSLTYREARVNLGRSAFRAALFDANCNGTFNDPGPVVTPLDDEYAEGQHGGDALYLGSLDDQEWAPDVFTPDSVPVAGYTLIGEDCLAVETAPDGSIMTWRAPDLPLGLVKASSPDYEAVLTGEQGTFRMANAKNARLPAGKYAVKFSHWTVEKKDAQGATWGIRGRDFDSSPKLRVRPHKQTVLPLPGSEPIDIQCTAAQSGKGDFLNLGLQMKGTGGTVYSPSVLTKNGERLQAPRFEVRDKTGKAVAQGQFEYG